MSLFNKGTALTESCRLQTRTHYVKLREEDLAAKKKNCESELSVVYLYLLGMALTDVGTQTSKWFRLSKMPWFYFNRHRLEGSTTTRVCTRSHIPSSCYSGHVKQYQEF